MTTHLIEEIRTQNLSLQEDEGEYISFIHLTWHLYILHDILYWSQCCLHQFLEWCDCSVTVKLLLGFASFFHLYYLMRVLMRWWCDLSRMLLLEQLSLVIESAATELLKRNYGEVRCSLSQPQNTGLLSDECVCGHICVWGCVTKPCIYCDSGA